MNDRWQLAIERIEEIAQGNNGLAEAFENYFVFVAHFIKKITEIAGKTDSLSRVELEVLNSELYADIIPSGYENSYANPDYCCSIFGEKIGKKLSFLYAQERGIIPFAYEAGNDEERYEDILILMELFLEIYSCISVAAKENICESDVPLEKQLEQILYWYVSDYADVTVTKRIREQLDPKLDFAKKIIMNSDLNDISYLYRFGEYISENEIKTAEYLNSLPEDVIQTMADTFTEGYRIGFVVTGKDLSIKKTVNIRYQLGFERVVRASVLNFQKMGLDSIIYRGAVHIANRSIAGRGGYTGSSANRQYDYDHREDMALFMDKAFKERKLELIRAAYEENKALAAVHAGPAVMETFGESPFLPREKNGRYQLDEKQQKLLSQMGVAGAAITNEYIKGEERSFTIIAYPIPEIGKDYERIFEETIKLNTLDYKTYEQIQQKLILALDKGQYVHIKGKNQNTTDIKISLRKLDDISKETQFENCVADVNIPVGEVFTSPVLKGSNGTLFVSQVYLNGLRFENLSITFEDGCVKDYTCSNFDEAAKNKEYIKKNILFGHDFLPIGEFAIGTNTTAYAMAKQFDIFDRLPILIAEKTGPHFAVGDTCYSHAEDVKVYNPDKREIVSRENDFSLLRNTQPEKAYFGCHTDITIPYDELGSITVYNWDKSSTVLIEDGKFVLDGTNELNKPLVNG